MSADIHGDEWDQMYDEQMREEFGEKIIRVHCSKCAKDINETEVGVLGIAEDIHGRDVLDFLCKCGSVEQSYRRG